MPQKSKKFRIKVDIKRSNLINLLRFQATNTSALVPVFFLTEMGMQITNNLEKCLTTVVLVKKRNENYVNVRNNFIHRHYIS